MREKKWMDRQGGRHGRAGGKVGAEMEERQGGEREGRRGQGRDGDVTVNTGGTSAGRQTQTGTVKGGRSRKQRRGGLCV